MPLQPKLPAGETRFSPLWQSEIGAEMAKPYFRDILKFLHKEKLNGKVIFPPATQVFEAFHLTPFQSLKVVIIGQDPYHGYGQAHGLSFSVQPGIRLPPSLKNIYKELKDDVGVDRGQNGCLNDWARQGVLMLNAALTVERGKASSHQKIGWHRFTDTVIRKISEDKDRLVFLLWGRFAQQKEGLINPRKHTILKSTHPSPFSAHKGFLGSKPFSQTNEILENSNLPPIQW